MVDLWSLISFFLSVAVALTIGGNLTFSMAAAFGSNSITKRKALVLSSIFLFFGAVTASGSVIENLNSGIIFKPIDLQISVAILLSTFLCILLANLIKVPISTSEVAVGSIVGVGIFFSALFSDSIAILFGSWIISAAICFLIAYATAKLVRRFDFKLPFPSLILVLIGCFFSFVLGANNVGNAVAPVLNFISLPFALMFGGISMVIGAFIFRGRVMEKIGKGITTLDTKSAIISSLTASILLLLMTFLGIPAPGAQIYTIAIIAVRQAKKERKKGRRTIIRILLTWLASPLIAILVSFFVLHLIF
ncbi:MAG TPA: inorganic phosphate transporter [Thermoplasmata archaeon]|nr:inorganic phosphate transporter [Thermoplasmata archaeon]